MHIFFISVVELPQGEGGFIYFLQLFMVLMISTDICFLMFRAADCQVCYFLLSILEWVMRFLLLTRVCSIIALVLIECIMYTHCKSHKID